MNKILESKGNFIVIKEDNFIKLFSYKSLVSIYNIETKTFEDIPYTFLNVYGTSSSHSSTTTRHINKFKRYVKNNF